MGRYEKVEELIGLVEKLRIDVDEGAVILVEGERDRHALTMLGVAGKVILLRELRRTIFTQHINKRVILLLDFDREGEKMTKHIVRELTSQGINVDLFYYRKLSAARRLGINTIEELGRYLRKV
ncbi:MAG: toprim domain-containing protein [Aigarchaeota archaeon]|nr:toprim domain-containing protein [Candidatus Pelearchaeum maunauluense]